MAAVPDTTMQVVQELLPPDAAGGAEQAAALKDAAAAWAGTHGMSVRSAAEFVRSCRAA
jgi:hypothetical protein